MRVASFSEVFLKAKPYLNSSFLMTEGLLLFGQLLFQLMYRYLPPAAGTARSVSGRDIKSSWMMKAWQGEGWSAVLSLDGSIIGISDRSGLATVYNLQ